MAQSGHGKKKSARGALTSWRAQKGGTSQGMDRKKAGKEHSRTGERIGMN
jgi:hypothetical protein